MKDGLLTFRRGLISPRPLKLANAPQSAFTFPENPTNHMTVLSQLEQLQPGQDAGNLRVSDCVSELRSNSDGKRALGDVFFFFFMSHIQATLCQYYGELHLCQV
jgi:hypothetical protein